MDKDTIIFLFVYGGFVAAFIFFLFASFVRKSNWIRWVWFICGFLALAYERICFGAAAAIGNATGGGTDSDSLMTPVNEAFFIAIAWWFALVFFVPIKKDEKKSEIHVADQKHCVPK